MARSADLNLTEIRRAIIECAATVGLSLAEQSQDAAMQDANDRKSLAGYSQYNDGQESDLLTIALAWISIRRNRDAIFGSSLFADPAWDMLLDLYVNYVRNKSVSVTSLCLASEVPTTTALRWITVLEGSGLIRRLADPNDRRRSYILLTETGIEKMEAALTKSRSSESRLGLGRLGSL